MSLRRPTKLFLLFELIDLLTTMIGVGLLGLVEYNSVFLSWRMENIFVVKLLVVWTVVTVLEFPLDYGWLAWLPCAIAFLPIPGNVYMILSVL